MKLIIAQDEKDWVKQTALWLEQKCHQHQARSLYLPAGETPKLIYHDWELRKPDFLNKLKMIQIDDVLNGERKNLFQQFFYEELPSFANKIEYFTEGQSQADLGILGIGLNGHVAFHEPHINHSLYSGCVKLDEVTLKNLNLAPETWGKTYGVQAFNSCKALLIIVRGEKKKQILYKILKENLDAPATQLTQHPDLTILTDFDI